MTPRNLARLLFVILLMAGPAHAVFNVFAPVFRYTDLGAGQVRTEVGTLYLDGSFVPNSSVDGPLSGFDAGVLAAISGKAVSALVAYDGFKGVVNRKFRRSAQTYAISGAPWVIITVSGVKPPKPTLTIAATDAAASETDLDPGEYKIMLDAPTSVDITVRFAIGGSAKRGRDYEPFRATLKIPAGNTSGIIDLSPIDDARREPEETVNVILQSGATYKLGEVGLRRATVRIADND